MKIRQPRKPTKTATKRRSRVNKASTSGTIRKRRVYKKRPTTSASIIELILRKAMNSLGIPYVEQYRIRRTGRNSRRSFYVDFAIPEKMLAIECDGRAYHTGKFAAYHNKRQKEIEDLGWHFIRFTGSEICKNPAGCARTIKAYLGGSKT